MENYVGKRLDGRYEIQEIIGVGGMAVVYKAYDSIDDRIVAIKVLKDEFLAKEEFRRRFKNESKAIAILSHPNIVRVYDVSFGDRLQYIVMEYVEGITLKEYIEQCGVVNWNEALFFVIQILRALQHAHDKGIVHRDIKPQNIMLLDNGLIKVTDFGIARFSRGETRTITEKAIGSVHYISPEQAKGQLTDEKADIYSIGVVLYEMLTGKLPFDADNAVSVALMQLQVEAEPLRSINPDIPIGFEQITLKAMQKNTRDRYQTVSEMLLDLEELKMNPNIKFDYQNYFVDDEPTRFIGKIQEKTIPAKQNQGSVQATGEYKPLKSANYDEQQYGDYREEHMQRAQTAVKTRDDKSEERKKNLIIIGGVVFVFLLILAIVLGIFIKNGTLTLGSKRVDVESFIGADYIDDIMNNEEYKDVYNFEVVYVASSDFEEGTVTDQDPKAGDSIVKGGVVKLYVAKSGEGQIIPDFTGKNYKTARDTLESMGFVVTLQATENESVLVGNVINTNPAANTSVLEGSTITIFYAVDTNEQTQFKMPSLEGMSLAEAKLLLERNELVVSKVETVDSSIAADYVVSQSPADGSPVRKGDSVIITVSTGFVTGEINIQLPSSVGVVDVYATVNGVETFREPIDTAAYSTYAISIKGNTSSSDIKVYIDNCLYYEAVGDFTKDDVKISNAKTYSVAFYKDVTGLSEAEAIANLKSLGYQNIQIVREVSDQPVGTVIGQSPTFASAPHVDIGTMIVLTVSSGMVSEAETTTTEPVSAEDTDEVFDDITEGVN
ncbi:MAG: Stk1 family PASTA domain-containing Ser/Thr kinase [Clostridia bacterium]|nr:Stk1 family PASTA domain-containing Ser/Thr kinase [Clostridia bacterium]